MFLFEFLYFWIKIDTMFLSLYKYNIVYKFVALHYKINRNNVIILITFDFRDL